MRCSLLKNASVLALLLSACSPIATFSPWGGVCAKRAPDCAFQVISSRPGRDYQVIGVIDIEAMHVRKIPNDEATFRRVIQGEVCRAGGDAVIAGVNRDKRYVLATVVKWVSPGREAAICPKAEPDAGRPKAGQAHDGGSSDAAKRNSSAPDAGSPGLLDAGALFVAPASDAAFLTILPSEQLLGGLSSQVGAAC